jgi:hypothetical protein
LVKWLDFQAAFESYLRSQLFLRFAIPHHPPNEPPNLPVVEIFLGTPFKIVHSRG